MHAIENPDQGDYWALATVGEAKLLALDVDAAVAGYTEAVAQHSEQKGSISSTREQLEKLLAVMDLDATDETRLLSALGS